MHISIDNGIAIFFKCYSPYTVLQVLIGILRKNLAYSPQKKFSDGLGFKLGEMCDFLSRVFLAVRQSWMATPE